MMENNKFMNEVTKVVGEAEIGVIVKHESGKNLVAVFESGQEGDAISFAEKAVELGAVGSAIYDNRLDECMFTFGKWFEEGSLDGMNRFIDNLINSIGLDGIESLTDDDVEYEDNDYKVKVNVSVK